MVESQYCVSEIKSGVALLFTYLDDVELDERALGPAVEREVPVARGLDVGLVGDGPVVIVSEHNHTLGKLRFTYLAEAGFQPMPETMLPLASVHSRE